MWNNVFPALFYLFFFRALFFERQFFRILLKMAPTKRKATSSAGPSKKPRFNPLMPKGSHKATPTELKFVDASGNPTIPAGAGTWSSGILLNATVPGTTATTRIGRQITMKSLELRSTASLASTSTQGGSCRLLIVYDKESKGAAPGITDILESDSFYSFKNLSNPQRFVTLVDHVYDSLTSAGDFTVDFNTYRKMALPVQYNTGSAGTVADINWGAVYAFACQNGTIGTAGPLLPVVTRIRYTDN